MPVAGTTRSLEACLKTWICVWKECKSFSGQSKRVDALKLTGNPFESDLDHCVSLLYSDRICVISHLYDCIKNPNHHVKKPFMFLDQCKWLHANKQLIHGDAKNPTEEDKQGFVNKLDRPTGVKKAKKEEEEKKKGMSTTEGDVQSVAVSIDKINKTMLEKVETPKIVGLRKLNLDRERFL